MTIAASSVCRTALISLATLAVLVCDPAAAQPQDPGSAIARRLTDAMRASIGNSPFQEQLEDQFGPEIYTRMLRGDAVSLQEQTSRGLVFVNGCSGVLLNNQWALTAGHCFVLGMARAANVTLAGTTIQSSLVYGFGRETNSANVSIPRGVDMALVRTSVPFFDQRLGGWIQQRDLQVRRARAG